MYVDKQIFQSENSSVTSSPPHKSQSAFLNHIDMDSSKMSPYSEQKKRPPPIRIPSRPPPQIVPGPNAFAIATRVKQEDERKQQQQLHQGASSVHYKKQTSQSAVHTPATSPLDDTHVLQPATESHSQRGRGSAMTTFTQLIEAARSPRKSDSHASSTASQRGSTARSRHSNRSQRSTEPPFEDNEVTSRAHIESRKEGKYFNMMGQTPPSPYTSKQPMTKSIPSQANIILQMSQASA